MSAARPKFHLRPAEQGDIEGILAVKNALTIKAASTPISREGFLLGSSPALYKEYIKCGIAYVIEDTATQTIKGIGFALPWALLRTTEIWQKRSQVRWYRPILADMERGKPGYIEQLAVLPHQTTRFLAPALGLALIERLFELGHSHLLATTVLEPIRNVAALKLLGLINAEAIGEIEERYDKVGSILSQVHHVSLEAYRTLRDSTSWQARVLNYLEKTAIDRSTLARRTLGGERSGEVLKN